ncbi:MAG: carboxypeptidase-like regulatory domain-containing protein [Myxococcales bacterium]
MDALPQSPSSAPLAASASCDEQGHFTLTGLEDVAYVLTARLEQMEGSGTAAKPGGESVVLVVERQGEVVGRVVKAGQPVTSFFVDGSSFESEDGTFQLSQAAGTREITLAGSFAPRAIPVTVRPGQTTDVGVIAVAASSSIVGVVRGPDGAPAAGLEVVLRYPDPSGEERASADVDGRFRFVDLAAGEYQLSAAGAQGLVLPVHVQLQEGQALPVSLSAEASGRLAGSVSDAGGSLVRFAKIEVYGPTPNEVQTTACDRAGEFSFDGLQPGTYRVVAASATSNSVSTERVVEVHGRAVTRADLRLPVAVLAAGSADDSEM